MPPFSTVNIRDSILGSLNSSNTATQNIKMVYQNHFDVWYLLSKTTSPWEIQSIDETLRRQLGVK
jgi:hypothetical protein